MCVEVILYVFRGGLLWVVMVMEGPRDTHIPTQRSTYARLPHTNKQLAFSSTAVCVSNDGLATAIPSPTRSSSRSTKRAMASKRAASAYILWCFVLMV